MKWWSLRPRFEQTADLLANRYIEAMTMQNPEKITPTSKTEPQELLLQLLDLAERELGPRDSTVQIHPVRISTKGPRLMNLSPNGAYILLSPNSAIYHPTMVYEMAHEVVHLLNPTLGYTNWLEEGVAVAFSLHAMRTFGHTPFEPPGIYLEALNLVESMPEGPFASGRQARELAGAMRAVNLEHLKIIAPRHPEAVLQKLASQCIPW